MSSTQIIVKKYYYRKYLCIIMKSKGISKNWASLVSFFILMMLTRLLYNYDSTLLIIPGLTMAMLYWCFKEYINFKFSKFLIHIVLCYGLLGILILAVEVLSKSGLYFDILFLIAGTISTAILALSFLTFSKLRWYNLFASLLLFPLNYYFVNLIYIVFTQLNEILPYFYILITNWQLALFLYIYISYRNTTK